MNTRLGALQPYPFERLRALTEGIVPALGRTAIDLSIGEPKHATPACIREALVRGLEGLSTYPATLGSAALREAIADWICRRYSLNRLDPHREVLPVNGSREALFAFAQTVIDSGRGPNGQPTGGDSSSLPIVVMPDPFYQIYEGAALLAGALPYFVSQTPEHGFACDWTAIAPEIWARTQLLFVCTPGNPTGRVMTLDEWRLLFALADEHDFVIASDECYSEIWFEHPPLGALEAAQALGRTDWRRLVVFSSLSKRSSVPGMRSGFVAGDAEVIAPFLRYRTYHGSAMGSPIQAASMAAWQDEAHVIENRALYSAKFDAVLPVLQNCLDVTKPDAGFYLWAGVPGGDDVNFTLKLLRQANVRVLPGSLISRESGLGLGRTDSTQIAATSPGSGRIRIALVEPLDRCLEAAHRMAELIDSTA
jgi:N-succinyldiaminopimelate aminotransferase